MNNLQQKKISGENSVRSQAEVARIMTERGYPMGRSNVYALERNALKKMAEHPLLASLAVELGLLEDESE